MIFLGTNPPPRIPVTHQDYFIFGRESQPKPSFVIGILGGRAKVYYPLHLANKNSWLYMGVSENNGFSPQIIHLFNTGFPLFFTIHFGVPSLFLDFHPCGCHVHIRVPWMGVTTTLRESKCENPREKAIVPLGWWAPSCLTHLLETFKREYTQ